ncbi:UDP-glucose:undecaprenyl-phosphate glucose-1-phosphate transferase [Rosistilla carotiformis]|uniref:UDP-glucose:undecaprenyl-phosphate glucose-1-phosphate transferase n=1 Tax=Rosistilla carotiformis TaxID=2528017 RepID=A0A518JQB6_9BACT|nr:sugar transferase [Rosistilla carotiformis]QDV67740.1 UDP-glucose:undecaprenyl-phosphate glucose-1-phosphate transferase [Rosistilla carotiformis]
MHDPQKKMRSDESCVLERPLQTAEAPLARRGFRGGEFVGLLAAAELPTRLGTPLWKRSCDIVGSLFLLSVLWPFLLGIALYIRLVSKGPALFLQRRVGEGGQHFNIIKFRTMDVRPEATAEHRKYVERLTSQDTPIEKPDHVNRLIRGGDFLRRNSIDELPQLFNVLMGTMSLVGPRPDLLELEDYQAWQLRRFEVLPGMTGLWQVSGKNRLTFREMIQLDIQYVEARSFALDLRILLKTFAVVVQQDND